MKDEDFKNILIVCGVVVAIVVLYILSWLFMKPQSKKGDALRPPVNRIEKIREGFTDK